MSVDYDELAKELATMSPRSRLFGLIKAEMKKRGHWQDKPRGIGFKKGKDSRRVTLKPVKK